MATPQNQARLAVLIDADNVAPKHAKPLLDEIAKYGTATVRRAYGDWTKANLAGWKATVLDHSIQPMQQFANTSGKGATDASLIIDAMDLLHAGNLDGFCLVSSDSDYTRLASRIREQGLVVYGLGEAHTPKALVRACNVFIYLGNLGDKPTPKQTGTKQPFAKDSPLTKALAKAVDTATDDTDWAHLGAVGSNLSRFDSDFDTRTWGFTKLKDLMRAHPDYELKTASNGTGPSSAVYVRSRRTAKANTAKARTKS